MKLEPIEPGTTLTHARPIGLTVCLLGGPALAAAAGSAASCPARGQDGWGHVHLYDAATGEELDTFAIPEAMDPAFASGFGDLTVPKMYSPESRSL